MNNSKYIFDYFEQKNHTYTRPSSIRYFDSVESKSNEQRSIPKQSSYVLNQSTAQNQSYIMRPSISSHNAKPNITNNVITKSSISNVSIPQGARLVRTYLDHSRASNVQNYN